MIELLKAVLFGIVEGITEWLPISSTGHLILLNEFINLQVSDEFQSMFDVVIQLGAILAVIVLFFRKLNPFALGKTGEEKTIVFGLTGTGYFDMMSYEKFHNGVMQDYRPTDEEIEKAFEKLPTV